MGWRYLLIILGGITLSLWAVRFFTFTLLESPRFLAGIGRDADAIEVIHKLAEFNGKTSLITLEELEAPERAISGGRPSSVERHKILSKSSKYDTGHIKALFATPKMAWSTSLLIAIWGKDASIAARAMTNKTQVLSDLPPRCITISCHICGSSTWIYRLFVSCLVDFRAVAQSSGMDRCTLPIATHV
jgi:hypothetical protein